MYIINRYYSVICLVSSYNIIFMYLLLFRNVEIKYIYYYVFVGIKEKYVGREISRLLYI